MARIEPVAGAAQGKASKGASLAIWIFAAALAGIVAGWAAHEFSPDTATAATFAGYFSIVTDVFLRLIKMIIAPLVFATLVVGIAHMGDTKAVGRIGAQGDGLVHHRVADVAAARHDARQPPAAGRGLNLPLPDAGAATNLKTGVAHRSRSSSRTSFPKSVFEAMANNEILQIVVFSVFFGVALASSARRPPS